jgi:hypothetical protein
MQISATAPIGQDFDGGLKSVYDDDPDREMAGQGLQSFPLIYRALGAKNLLRWEMAPSEQVALLFLLEQLRPKVAIEIGTRFGGSLQVLAQFCDRVYSLDIDPEVPRRLDGKFPNVEYLIGPSDQLLPPLLERLQREGAELSFALVDGDHTTDGVRKDIDNLLKFRPGVPLYIVMHDSINQNCRAGLRQANWAACPYVHAVELDFVAGTVNPSPAFRDQMWGGLALGILLPHARTGRFEITGRSERTHQTVLSALARNRSLLRRVAGKVKRMLSGR